MVKCLGECVLQAGHAGAVFAARFHYRAAMGSTVLEALLISLSCEGLPSVVRQTTWHQKWSAEKVTMKVWTCGRWVCCCTLADTVTLVQSLSFGWAKFQLYIVCNLLARRNLRPRWHLTRATLSQGWTWLRYEMVVGKSPFGGSNQDETCRNILQLGRDTQWLHPGVLGHETFCNRTRSY